MPQDAFALADDARERLEQLRSALNRHIRNLLMKLATKDGVLRRDEVVNAHAVATEVLQAIRQRGAVAIPSFLEEVAARVVTNIIKPGEAPPGFAANVGPEIDAIVRGQTREISAVFGRAHDAVRQAIDRGISTSAPLAELIDEVAARVDASFAQASSAVDTGIVATGRSIIIRQAQASGDGGGEEMVFKYVGPRDSKVREFCREQVGKYFTVAALDRLDNGAHQPKPVSRFCGGYLCRHSLAPIPRFHVEEQGFKVQE